VKESKEKKNNKKKSKKGKEGGFEQAGPGKSINDFTQCIEDHKKWDNVDETNNPQQKGNVDMLKSSLLEEIQIDVQKKVHKTILDELTAFGSNVRYNKQKRNKNTKRQRRNNQEEDEQDEETKLEFESKRIDRMFVRGKVGGDVPTRIENFEEMVKLRFIRKVKPITLDQIVGGFDYIASENIISCLDGEQGT